MSKPSLPQGTRDFGPETVRKRNHILDTIREVFRLYGFQPLETPAMENLETLMGKYGEEGDKLIFKILNNGLDHESKSAIARQEFEKVLQGKSSRAITERALRYDLTIPFARYVAMNHAQLSFPFRRYQVQPVWRADRPQKGRYREFYQCDADVVGSHSLINEVELALVYDEVFTRLGIKGYSVRINHRGLLVALAKACGTKLSLVTVAIDKLDKTGMEKVLEELSARGLNDEAIHVVRTYLGIRGDNDGRLNALATLFNSDPDATKAIEDLRAVFALLKTQQKEVALDLTLARGLDYYTGCIFEASAPAEVKIGSIGGGGRYDDLTGLFGVPNIPGVGISFGVDRIYDVMEELGLFPGETLQGTRVLFFNLGKQEASTAFIYMQKLRQRGVGSEIYHESHKFDRQFRYAEKKQIPYVIIIGETELKDNTFTVKNLQTGKQETVSADQIDSYPLT
jgi:histidyl-tRNA synthetase